MILGVSPELFVLIGIILFVGGLVTGVTGFGYALISTTANVVVLISAYPKPVTPVTSPPTKRIIPISTNSSGDTPSIIE